MPTFLDQMRTDRENNLIDANTDSKSPLQS